MKSHGRFLFCNNLNLVKLVARLGDRRWSLSQRQTRRATHVPYIDALLLFYKRDMHCALNLSKGGPEGWLGNSLSSVFSYYYLSELAEILREYHAQSPSNNICLLIPPHNFYQTPISLRPTTTLSFNTLNYALFTNYIFPPTTTCRITNLQPTFKKVTEIV